LDITSAVENSCTTCSTTVAGVLWAGLDLFWQGGGVSESVSSTVANSGEDVSALRTSPCFSFEACFCFGPTVDPVPGANMRHHAFHQDRFGRSQIYGDLTVFFKVVSIVTPNLVKIDAVVSMT